MGIFDFFRSDPSSEWPEPRSRSLVLDLRERSLDNIPLGAPASRLESIGRPTNRLPFRDERFLYAELGIVVEISSDKLVDYFGMPVVRREHDDIGPCRLEVLFPTGSRVQLSGDSEADRLLAELPKPESSEVDDEETVHRLLLEKDVLEIECSPKSGRLYRVNLYSE